MLLVAGTRRVPFRCKGRKDEGIYYTVRKRGEMRERLHPKQAAAGSQVGYAVGQRAILRLSPVLFRPPNEGGSA